jgi:hypothetical protein
VKQKVRRIFEEINVLFDVISTAVPPFETNTEESLLPVKSFFNFLNSRTCQNSRRELMRNERFFYQA